MNVSTAQAYKSICLVEYIRAALFKGTERLEAVLITWVFSQYLSEISEDSKVRQMTVDRNHRISDRDGTGPG